MRSFDELVMEADRTDVTGWDFDWLDGRATEERPPWGYAGLVADRLTSVSSAVDLQTGGGEVMARMPAFPQRMCVTEGWPPNVRRARAALGPRGVDVVEVADGEPLPFADGTFELVTSRHPVRPDWPQIHRVLADGGQYMAQHVGPASAFELIEYFLGPLPQQRTARDPLAEVAQAEVVGLTVTDLRTARCRMEFFDVGAVIYILRKCVWWVPDFSVDRYLERLRALDALIRGHGPFVAHSSRHLIEARRD